MSPLAELARWGARQPPRRRRRCTPPSPPPRSESSLWPGTCAARSGSRWLSGGWAGNRRRGPAPHGASKRLAPAAQRAAAGPRRLEPTAAEERLRAARPAVKATPCAAATGPCRPHQAAGAAVDGAPVATSNARSDTRSCSCSSSARAPIPPGARASLMAARAPSSMACPSSPAAAAICSAAVAGRQGSLTARARLQQHDLRADEWYGVPRGGSATQTSRSGAAREQQSALSRARPAPAQPATPHHSSSDTSDGFAQEPRCSEEQGAGGGA